MMSPFASSTPVVLEFYSGTAFTGQLKINVVTLQQHVPARRSVRTDVPAYPYGPATHASMHDRDVGRKSGRPGRP
jgi:hypothetical protein